MTSMDIFKRPFTTNQSKPNGSTSHVDRYESYGGLDMASGFRLTKNWLDRESPSDPFAEIKTGLPSNLAELAKDIDPQTLGRAMVGTVLAIKGFQYLRDYAQSWYQHWKAQSKYSETAESGQSSPYVAPISQHYESLSNLFGSAAGQELDTAFGGYKDGDKDEGRVILLIGLVKEYLDEHLVNYDPNDPGMVSDHEAQALKTMGDLGIPNELLAQIKHLPKDKLAKLTGLVMTKSMKDGFQSFDDPYADQKLGFRQTESLEDIYTKQKLGSLEAEGQ